MTLRGREAHQLAPWRGMFRVSKCAWFCGGLARHTSRPFAIMALLWRSDGSDG